MNLQLSLLPVVVILLSTSTSTKVPVTTNAFVAVNLILPRNRNRDVRSRIDSTTTKSNGSDDSDQSTIQEEWRRPELFGQSLIEQTLNDIQKATATTADAAPMIKLTKEERTAQRRSLRQATNIPNFEQHVHAMAPSSSSSSTSPLQLLHRKSIPSILQINIGLYCNQACQHCHGTFMRFVCHGTEVYHHDTLSQRNSRIARTLSFVRFLCVQSKVVPYGRK